MYYYLILHECPFRQHGRSNKKNRSPVTLVGISKQTTENLEEERLRLRVTDSA